MHRDLPLDRLRDAVRRIAAETAGRAVTGLTHDDAEGVTGTIATDSAFRFDPFPVLHALSRAGADVVVMGQVAGIMHGSTELTGDLDLLWDGDERQTTSLAAAFNAVGARLTDEDGSAVACTPAAFRLAKVYFGTETASGDCCTPVLRWGDLDIRGVLRRAEAVVDSNGLTIRYISAIDLTVMRDAAARPKDVRRNAELEALMRTAHASPQDSAPD